MTLADVYYSALRTKPLPMKRVEAIAAYATRHRNATLFGAALAVLKVQPSSVRTAALPALATGNQMLAQEVFARQGDATPPLASDDLSALGSDAEPEFALDLAQLLGNGFAGDFRPLADALWDRNDPRVRLQLLHSLGQFDYPEAWISWAMDPALTGKPVEDIIRDVAENTLAGAALACRAATPAAFLAVLQYDDAYRTMPQVRAGIKVALAGPVDQDVTYLAVAISRLRLDPEETTLLERIAHESGEPALRLFRADSLEAEELRADDVGAYLRDDPDPIATFKELLATNDSQWRIKASLALLGYNRPSVKEVLEVLIADLTPAEFSALVQEGGHRFINALEGEDLLTFEVFTSLPVTLRDRSRYGNSPSGPLAGFYDHLVRELDDPRMWETLEALAPDFTGTWGDLIVIAQELS